MVLAGPVEEVDVQDRAVARDHGFRFKAASFMMKNERGLGAEGGVVAVLERAVRVVGWDLPGVPASPSKIDVQKSDFASIRRHIKLMPDLICTLDGASCR